MRQFYTAALLALLGRDVPNASKRDGQRIVRGQMLRPHRVCVRKLDNEDQRRMRQMKRGILRADNRGCIG